MQQVSENTNQVNEPHHNVAIIGTGFAGLCMAIRLKQKGEEDFVLYEKAETLGGTWRDNTYPGCGCDVPSNLYSLSFEQNPNWSTKFASQSEILQYLYRLTEKYRVEQNIKFRTEITAMVWDPTRNRWHLDDCNREAVYSNGGYFCDGRAARAFHCQYLWP
jgi:cation diffusion facilitator CzcD-associated flavoprotein CzcO